MHAETNKDVDRFRKNWVRKSIIDKLFDQQKFNIPNILQFILNYFLETKLKV